MIQTQKKHIIELLRNIQLFSSLTEEELQQVNSKIAVKRFKKNGVILYEEDTNEFMYIILHGTVKVIRLTEDGKEILLAIHKSGDFFGEVSLIDKKTIPATVIAMEDSSIAIINVRDFFSLIYEQKKVLDNLLMILCSRLRESWERIQLLSFSNAEQKVKTIFFKLYHLGVKMPEGTMLKLTHQDIANMIGTSRETVSRIIDKWQKEGDLKVFRNKGILLKEKFFQKL
ncbi:MAG: Crp/Fnr family transcriptional regulator [Cytophagaceae bacterium]